MLSWIRINDLLKKTKNEETFKIEIEIRNDKRRQIISHSHWTLVWYVITRIVRDYYYPDVKRSMQVYFMVSEIIYETYLLYYYPRECNYCFCIYLQLV